MIGIAELNLLKIVGHVHCGTGPLTAQKLQKKMRMAT